jgi:hypothetical protein
LLTNDTKEINTNTAAHQLIDTDTLSKERLTSLRFVQFQWHVLGPINEYGVPACPKQYVQLR